MDTPRRIPQLHTDAALRMNRDELWEYLRTSQGPIARVEIEPGVAAWMTLGYTETIEVLRDASRFSNDPWHWSALRQNRISPQLRMQIKSGTERDWRSGPYPNPVCADGDTHARLRAPIADWTRHYLSSMQLVTDVAALTHQLIDAVSDTGATDLFTALTGPLPALMLNRQLGRGDDAGFRLAHLAQTCWDGDPDHALHAYREITEDLQALLADKRWRPGDDLASWLTHPRYGLTDAEAAATLSLIFFFGDGESHFLANTVEALLTDAQLRTDHAAGRISTEDRKSVV